MARKKKGGHEEPENAERWLLTYADMITLLMAFFIMMYSMSVLNLEKFNEAAFSIRSGFGGTLKGGKHLLRSEPGSGSGISVIAHIFEHERPLHEVKAELTGYSEKNNITDKVAVLTEKRGIVVSISADNLLFAAGSAEIKPAAFAILDKVASKVKRMPNDIMVEGHTCNIPISTSSYPSNWELSAARASSVVRYLTHHGVPPARLMAVGYGEARPRLPNDTEAHRAMNRRVDIVILDTDQESTSTVEQGSESPPDGSARRVRPNLRKVWLSDQAALSAE
ncbi:MAG: OmpA family protein [Armatimonadota bacterium]